MNRLALRFPGLFLAWRYMSYHRWRSVLLVACISLTMLLPFAVQVLVHSYGLALRSRAESTPMLVGAKGSRFDQVLSSLYFKGRIPAVLPYGEFLALLDSELCTPIPIHCRVTAQGYPVLGTAPEYFELRGLRFAQGEAPLILGQVALGASVAKQLNLTVGDTILSDRGSLYDLTQSYPLKMHVSGVLEACGGPEDRALIVDVNTAWVMEGIGHGHVDATEEDAESVLSSTESSIALSAATIEYTEISAENIDSFHFHAEEADLPLTGVIVLPDDEKSATILRGRYQVSTSAQLLIPTEVVDELLGFVFRIKAFFDANFILIAVSTTLLLGLVVMLSIRLRKRELDTFFKLGCARGSVQKIIGLELGLVLLHALLLTAALGSLLIWTFTHWKPLL